MVLHAIILAGVHWSLITYSVLQCRSLEFLQVRCFSSGVSCISRVPPILDPAERCFVLGHADGVVRLVSRSAGGWKLLQAIKPHKVLLRSFMQDVYQQGTAFTIST